MKYGGYDFSEMLADYKSVMCSDREDLKDFINIILPKECITFLEKFYMKMLSNYINIYKPEYSDEIRKIKEDGKESHL